MGCNIHPSAIVSPSAELDEEVQVGPYAVVGPHVKIGRGSILHSHCVVEGHTTMGAENEVFQFASIGTVPQDLKFKGEPAELIIGSRNKFREGVTAHIGTEPGGMKTVVGDDNLFMAYSHIAHDCIVGNGNVIANSVALAGHVTIGNRTILGGMTGIHQFCYIGDFAMISGGSMVGHDVPPFCFAQGDRAVLRGINVVGLKRGGIDTKDISDIRKVYRVVFGTMGHYPEKIDSLPTELKERPLIKKFVETILSSKRGVCKPGKEISDGEGL